ncbi:hypothetical protein [Ammoniphilus resinae]|uniref:Uncharacterized protein n=1 Tax=Ammoniphilus resinae TaxID=861532 RepID=A0ABS4GKD7_9BACL|nr:hypothetical protein [Ammoniphilus resinae]MBP1930612.1 hypothetical protein [Ammoniphilus resinae]
MQGALSASTVGNILARDLYHDLYKDIAEENNRYFSRRNSNGEVELIIAFDDIDDFSNSTHSNVMIDFQSYKDRFFLTVWTQTDPTKPLGFPIKFQLTEDADVEKLEQIFNQDKIWIHYLATENEELIHVFSEAYDLPEGEWEQSKKLFIQALSQKDQPHTESEIIPFQIKEADHLHDSDLTQEGIGYLLDFSSLIQKWGEEEAKVKLMESLLQAMQMIQRHPREEVRQSRLLIWVAERAETTNEEKESRLISLFVTPNLQQWLDIVSEMQEFENPLSTVLLAFPEFLMTLEDNPLKHGAFPLILYEQGSFYHLELDEDVQDRLEKLYSFGGRNPYHTK